MGDLRNVLGFFGVFYILSCFLGNEWERKKKKSKPIPTLLDAGYVNRGNLTVLGRVRAGKAS